MAREVRLDRFAGLLDRRPRIEKDEYRRTRATKRNPEDSFFTGQRLQRRQEGTEPAAVGLVDAVFESH